MPPELPLQPDLLDAILDLESARPLVEERQLKLEELDRAKADLEEKKRDKAEAETDAKEQAKAVAALEADVRLLEAQLADRIRAGLLRPGESLDTPVTPPGKRGR